MTTKEPKKKTVKKEEAKKDPEISQEQMQMAAAQMIQGYFTREVNDQVRDMSNDMMQKKLRELEGSEYWIAILRYNNLRLLNAQSAINTIDPISNPSAIRRLQGTMEGLVDLQNGIIQMAMSERAVQEETESILETF